MRRFLAAILVSALLAPACADREGQAREAMREAARAVAEGRKLEATSWSAALERYEAALARIGEVREKHAGTEAAALAKQPTTYVGPLTLGVLEGAVLPAVRRRAEAEAGALPCAAWLAETVPAPLPRVRALVAVAGHATKAGEPSLGPALLQRARATVEGLPVDSPARAAAWAELAEGLLAVRDLEGARAVILAQGLADAWQRLAIAHVGIGQTKRAAGMIGHSPGGAAMPRLEALTTIASALSKEGDAAAARALMQEAEARARGLPPAERARVALLLARHYAGQGSLAQAESWLGQGPGLRDATLAELDGLVAAYKASTLEARLLGRVHQDLALLEAGTREPPRVEVPWLANMAYLQARLGEPEPGAFALARARLLADGIAPPGAGQAAIAAEADTLLDVAERLLALAQAEPAMSALDDVAARLGELAGAPREERLARLARLAAQAGKGDRALRAIAAIGDQARAASALAGAAAAARTGLIVGAEPLHALIVRFDPGAPGLQPGGEAPASATTP